MLLTAARTTMFYENADQMGIPNVTVVQTQQEGIDTVDDLVDFDKDTIERLLLTFDALQEGYLILTLQRQ